MDSDIFFKLVTYWPTLSKFRGGAVKKKHPVHATLYEDSGGVSKLSLEKLVQASISAFTVLEVDLRTSNTLLLFIIKLDSRQCGKIFSKNHI